MAFEKYDFSSEYQDHLLACIMTHPEKFTCYDRILCSHFFSALPRVVTARVMFAYFEKRKRFPTWDVLQEKVMVAIERTEENKESTTIAAYLKRIEAMDTGDVDEIVEQAVDFAKNRAQWHATEYIYTSFSERTFSTSAIIARMYEIERIGAKNGHYGPGGPGVITVEEIADDDGEPPDAVIEGLLADQGLMVLSGRAKSQKSFVALELGLCVARGVALFLDKFETKQRPVVYINFELSEKTVKRRVKKIAEALKIKLGDLAGKFFAYKPDLEAAMAGFPGKEWRSRRNWFTEAIAQQVEALIMRLIGKTAAFIIWDSYYNLCGNIDENDAAETKGVYACLRRCHQRLGASGLIIHHFSKGAPGEKMAGERAAGSRVHRQEPDAYMELVPHEEDDALILTADVRDYAPVRPQCYRWKFPLLELANDLDPEQVKRPPGKAGGNSKGATVSQVLGVLDRPMTAKEWQKECYAELGISRATFYRAKLCAEGSGKLSKFGEKYEVSVSRETASP